MGAGASAQTATGADALRGKSVDDVCALLEETGLGKYQESFREEKITGDVLAQLLEQSAGDVTAVCTGLDITKSLDKAKVGVALEALQVPGAGGGGDTVENVLEPGALECDDDADTAGAVTKGFVCVMCGAWTARGFHPECSSLAVHLAQAKAAAVEAEQVLGSHLQLKRLLGQGGFGAVWVAIDFTMQGEERAVKLLTLGPRSDRAAVTSLRRFFLEASLGAKIIHENLGRVFEASQDAASGAVFLSMELLQGRSLQQVLKEDGPLPEALALSCCVQVLRALQALHEAGVAHRDVKPANVMLLPSGVAKLIDLGIAKLLGGAEEGGLEGGEEASDITSDGEFVASLPYTAPERLVVGAVADPRSDLFAVGVMLHELLVGEKPFRFGRDWHSRGHAAIMSQPFPRAQLAAVAPTSVVEAVVRACATRPEERFASAREMEAALGGGSSGQQAQAEGPEAATGELQARLAALEAERDAAQAQAAAAQEAAAHEAAAADEERARIAAAEAAREAHQAQAEAAAEAAREATEAYGMNEAGEIHLNKRLTGCEYELRGPLTQFCPKLTTLWLTKMPEMGAEIVAGVVAAATEMRLPALLELNLSGNSIGEAGATAVAEALHHLPNLHHLGLGGNSIGEAGATAVAEALHHLPNLQHLGLGGNTIGETGATAVAEALHHLPNLQGLSLGANSIGDAGATAVAEALHHLPNLQQLFLGGNSIGDAGAMAVAEALHHLPNLQGLFLSRVLLSLSPSRPAPSLSPRSPTAPLPALGPAPLLPPVPSRRSARPQSHPTGCWEVPSRRPASARRSRARHAAFFVPPAPKPAPRPPGRRCAVLTRFTANSIGDAGATAVAEALRHLPNLKQLLLLGDNEISRATQTQLEGEIKQLLPNCRTSL